MALDSGWIYIYDTDGSAWKQVYCEHYEWDDKDTGTIFIDYPADGHYGFTMNTRQRKVTIKNIYFDNKNDFDTFMALIQTNLEDGESFDLKIMCSSSSDYEKFDGTNHIMPVLVESIKGVNKIVNGDSQYRQIKRLIFRQAGALKSS